MSGSENECALCRNSRWTTHAFRGDERQRDQPPLQMGALERLGARDEGEVDGAGERGQREDVEPDSGGAGEAGSRIVPSIRDGSSHGPVGRLIHPSKVFTFRRTRSLAARGFV
jgi:hypothetical protein